MIKFLNKFSTVKFADDFETAIIEYNFFGIKIRHRNKKHPILNKKLCNKAGFKTLLISRFDGIGDYLLMRPFFKRIKNSKKYKDYKLIFAGRTEFIELAKRYDDDYIDYYLPCNTYLTESKTEYKKTIKASFNTYIDPVDSLPLVKIRRKTCELIRADEKYCNISYFAHINAKSKNLDIDKYCSKYFNKIIYNPEDPIFVRESNKIFFEKVIGESIDKIDNLSDLKETDVNFKDKYVTVSAFARCRADFKSYSFENYSKIIDYITDELNIPVVLLGSFVENDMAQELKNMCKRPDMVINMAGKLSIGESSLYIRNSYFLLANETGTVHIAQNYGVKTVCISNGSYMGTFQPYPKDESYITYVYPDNIDEYLVKNPDCKGQIITIPPNNIPPQKVIDAIKSII